MIKNYLKVAWRNLLKNKTHTFINITGLSVGMAIAIVIGLWIWDELNYDKNFKNYDRIAQVWQHQSINGKVGSQTSMPIPLGYNLRDNFKSDFKYVVLSSWNSEHILANGDKKLNVDGSFMQNQAPYMLTLDMLKGTRDGLKDPNSILLSEKTANAVFGTIDAVDKTIKLDNKYLVKVTGVYKTLPKSNSRFNELGYILPWELYLTTQTWLQRAQTQWGNNSFQIFVQLNDHVDVDNASKHIKNVKAKYLETSGDNFTASFKPTVFLHPMKKWHLFDEFKDGVNTGGDIQWVWLFAIIGIMVLLLACINFMNLSTARSEKRAKEVGIRKAIGSVRGQLISQFFSESLMLSVFAFWLSILLVLVMLPWFNQVAGKQIGVLWGNPVFWLIGLGFSLLTGLIAGSYPAFYLSSFQPVKVLKGTYKAGKGAALPRQVLVILQFFASVTLIIGTVVVFKQVQHTKNRPVGYNREGVIQLNMKTDDIHKHFASVRTELLQSGLIVDIAETGSPLTDVYSNQSGFSWRGKNANLQDDFAWVPVSPEYAKVSGWQLIEGRNFTNSPADSSAVMLNEASVKFMGFKNPIGEIIRNGNNKLTIVGVVRDMVMSSPYEPVKTTLFIRNYEAANMVAIRLKPGVPVRDALAKVESVFKTYDPGSPFDYRFTDEEYAKKFATEERIGKLAGFFTFLAIFISCMGLFGMASFMAEQRTKEIGVRKVLGATVFNLWQMMSTDFVKLVCVSLALAIPTAYYVMQSWLQEYKYRTDLSWWVFAATALGAIGITLLTVSYQSVRAALSNPVRSLRSE